MVREREAGTLEQLLMSPASTSEIIIAKITPLFLLLFLMMFLAIGVLKFAFGVPFHGNVLLLVAGGALCILSGISIGTVISTFSKSAQQAQLTCFFVNPPLSSLSGALNPVEAMPKWLQPFTVLNPISQPSRVEACSRAVEFWTFGRTSLACSLLRWCLARSASGDSESSSVKDEVP
jgi:ABC-2 type transport system permease protein